MEEMGKEIHFNYVPGPFSPPQKLTYLKTSRVRFMEILEQANNWAVKASIGIQTQVQLLYANLAASALAVFLESQR